MAKTSAGLLMYRWRETTPEVLLVHPGGPFWAGKDRRAWSIPKGECGPEEESLAAAKREFEEETGLRPKGRFVPLTPLKQPSGKVVHAWAFEGDGDAGAIVSNTFVLEWPPRSGKRRVFPEVDRAAWFPFDVAREKVHRGQVGLLDELERLLSGDIAARGADPTGER